MNQKQLLTSFAVVSLVTMGVGFYRTLKKKSSEQKVYCEDLQQQEEEISRELDNLNTLQNILSSKAQDIELKYSKRAPHILSSQCLKQILEFTSQIVDKNELEVIFINNRKARRSCFSFMKNSLGQEGNSSLETYYRFVCTFNQQIQYLIQKSQKDFVVFLNIEYTLITESIDYYNSQGENQFAQWVRMWTNQIKQQLRERLPLYQKPVNPNLILEIAQYQIQVLTSEGDSLKQAILNLHLESQDEQEAIPTFFESFLEDIIYEKYGIQIEQTNLAVTDVTPELQQKFHILSELKNSILQGMMNFQNEQQFQDDDDDSENIE